MENPIKYPRTLHLPWSPGATKDDKVLKDVNHFKGLDVVVSLKLDGENTTLYRDYMHARSIDSKDHESRHWLKGFHAASKHRIPSGWRVCGENLFAQHSISYIDLESYFLVFSVWTEENICLSQDETDRFCAENGFSQVPEILCGKWRDEEFFNNEFKGCCPNHEGYVIRLSKEFRYEDFNVSVAKYVRANHVQTDDHWMFRKVVPNKLR